MGATRGRLFESLKGWLGFLRQLVTERPRRFAFLWVSAFVAYQLFLVAPFLFTFGSLPNYFKVYDAWGGIVESIWLRPPLGSLWELIEDQPVYEFGIQDRFGYIPAQFVATVHNVVSMVVLPALLALSLSLQIRAWSLLKEARRRAPVLAGASTGTIGSLFGASTSAVACCGASAGPVLLTMLGFGFGTASVISEYAAVLEFAGYILLVGSVVGLAGWIRARTHVSGYGPDRPLASGTNR